MTSLRIGTILVAMSAFSLPLTAAQAAARMDMAECADTALEGEVYICRDEIDADWAQDAIARRDGYAPHVERRDDRLLVVVRSENESTRLCCSIQEPMVRIDEDHFAAQFRLRHLDEAHLFFINFGATSDDLTSTFIGPQGRPQVEMRDLEGTVHHREIESAAHRETRRVILYLPPDFDPDTPFALLTLMDGGAAPYTARSLEPLMAAGRLPPVVILGIVSGAEAIIPRADYGFDVRNADYLPGFHEETDRFAAHLNFVVDEALPLTLERFEGREPFEHIIAGYSSGATFAHEAAMRRPEAFTGAIVMSRGRPLVFDPGEDAAHVRFVLSAGLYEERFRVRTREAAEALREAGLDVRYTDYPDGHSPRLREFAIVDGLLALLGEEE